MPITAGDRVQIVRDFKNGTREDFEGCVTWVEDRGEYLYFGYRPVKPGTHDWDSSRGQWGCCRAYKDVTPPWAARVFVLGTCIKR